MPVKYKPYSELSKSQQYRRRKMLKLPEGQQFIRDILFVGFIRFYLRKNARL